jgi:hypothetical protein
VAVEATLRHLAWLCAALTARKAAGARAVARRCLFELCALAGALQAASYACDALQVTLLHLLKVRGGPVWHAE